MAPPFRVRSKRNCFVKLRAQLASAEASRDIAFTRIGVELSGRYHDSLVARLQNEGVDVVVLSPSQAKDNCSPNLLCSVQADIEDLDAIAELMIRGLGRPAA